jgi:hypothetical protein
VHDSSLPKDRSAARESSIGAAAGNPRMQEARKAARTPLGANAEFRLLAALMSGQIVCLYRK